MDILLGLALIGVLIVIGVRIQSRIAENTRREQREQEAAEARQLHDCEEVVRYFANYHGHTARSVVSRDELAERIDSGTTADELRNFIYERIYQADGIEIGYQSTGNGGLPVILPNEYRDKHIYVIGKSGYGKSNFLRYLMLQDMEAGNGIGVLAPEYELLSDELLPYIPEHRINDVIYVNPADFDAPVIFNPLHCEQGDDIDLQADETFTVLQRVVGEGGPRMDEILRHTLYALMERPGSTLLDIERLLDRHDSILRDEIIATTQDERTRRFFKNTYSQFPRESHLPITNRIGRIIRTKFARNCLCPPEDSGLALVEINRRLLNFRQAMDEGKILLFNVSDGILGEAASQMIGQFIVSKFQTAAMSRADIPKESRKPFFLYLDEFQNFCGTASKSYEKILSRARKYRLGLILAHQQTGQLPPELLREVFGNVSTMVSFQVSQVDAARLSKEFISQYDFDIESLPLEELLSLNVGEAYCRVGRSTFPMRIPLIDAMPDHGRANEVIRRSSEQYGIPQQRSIRSEAPKDVKGTEDPLAGINPEGIFE